MGYGCWGDGNISKEEEMIRGDGGEVKVGVNIVVSGRLMELRGEEDMIRG